MASRNGLQVKVSDVRGKKRKIKSSIFGKDFGEDEFKVPTRKKQKPSFEKKRRRRPTRNLKKILCPKCNLLFPNHGARIEHYEGHYHQPEVVDLHLPILLKEYAKSLPSLRYNGNMTSTAFSTEILRLRRDEFNRLQGLNEPSTSLPTTTPPSTPPRTVMPPPSTEAASTSTPPPCARAPVPSIPSSPVQVVMKFDPHDDRPGREPSLPEEEPPSDTGW
ncbi:unnamed protein product [Cyprideis torosa]|uniref:Uncharacterized protein n=1 Tax=Cyprideis torosa TaxID=163714 RepID=A0A7R8WNX0_9CRUS|nr:unnamed protein product [Cyprideis torosa]CAG0905122.1 unnamed protein product [Cyprideis torosa]